VFEANDLFPKFFANLTEFSATLFGIIQRVIQPLVLAVQALVLASHPTQFHFHQDERNAHDNHTSRQIDRVHVPLPLLLRT
jgi:hypothetical protein